MRLLFSYIVSTITSFRNFLYDKKILSTIKFRIPIISVGNLSVGGTGKTPLVEYIASYYIKKKYNIAILSRGYKRKTTGFIIADKNQNHLSIGDEPMQYYMKFNNKLIISVCEDRVYGISKILHDYPKTNLIILDDGFQQRKIDSSFNIVLSDSKKPFFSDYLLPFGLLREKRKNILRSDILIFSKVSKKFSNNNFELYKLECKKYLVSENKIFFTNIFYYNLVPLFGFNFSIDKIKDVITVSSISDSSLFLDYIKSKYKLFKSYDYPDHYNYSLKEIINVLSNLKENRILIITEKDAPKFKFYEKKLSNYPIYVLPIKVNFCYNKNKFFYKTDSYLNLYKTND